MFKDFYEDGLFKKTTEEEKKEVVNNTGDWFPEQQDNKIKGMDKVVDKIVENAVEKQNDIVNCRPGYAIKHCRVCGNKFESYRGRGVYCSDRCRREGAEESRKKYIAKNSGFVYVPKKTQRQEHKVGVGKGNACKKFVTEEIFNKAKRLRSTGMTIAEVAAEMGYSAMFMQRVLRNDTYTQFALQRKREYERRRYNEGKLKKVPEDKPITHVETVEVVEPQQQPQPQPEPEENSDMKYLALMQKVLSIVSIVKSTSDVKECINKVFDALNDN